MIRSCIAFFFPSLDPNHYAQFGIPRAALEETPSATSQLGGMIKSVGLGGGTTLMGLAIHRFEMAGAGVGMLAAGVSAATLKGMKVVHLLSENIDEWGKARAIILRQAGSRGLAVSALVGGVTDMVLRVTTDQQPSEYTLLTIAVSSVAGYAMGQYVASTVMVSDRADQLMDAIAARRYQQLGVVVSEEGEQETNV